MKLLLLINLVFCLGLTSPLQAQDTLRDSILVVIPGQFYTETHQPFFTWNDEPQSFDFVLCDRWGEIIVSAKENPHFIIDDLLEEKKIELKANSTYVIILEFIGSDGVQRKISKPGYYWGFYCSG
ncbi:MAG TPA: hypothetical protein VK151_02575 [Fluviicola sp.]|nr:hypothetical protein [Fluviicola sp.]